MLSDARQKDGNARGQPSDANIAETGVPGFFPQFFSRGKIPNAGRQILVRPGGAGNPLSQAWKHFKKIETVKLPDDWQARHPEIKNAQDAARLQNAPHFVKSPPHIRQVAQNKCRNDGVETFIGKRQGESISFQQIYGKA